MEVPMLIHASCFSSTSSLWQPSKEGCWGWCRHWPWGGPHGCSLGAHASHQFVLGGLLGGFSCLSSHSLRPRALPLLSGDEGQPPLQQRMFRMADFTVQTALWTPGTAREPVVFLHGILNSSSPGWQETASSSTSWFQAFLGSVQHLQLTVWARCSPGWQGGPSCLSWFS